MLDTDHRRSAIGWRVSIAGVVILMVVVAAVLLWGRMRQSPQRQFQEALQAIQDKDVKRLRQIAVVLDEYPNYAPHAHLLWGILAIDGGRPQEAISELTQAVDHVEPRVLALTFLGEVYYHLNRYVDAEKVLLAAINEDPAQPDSRRWLAAVYYDLGAFDLAIDNLLIVSRLAPQDYRPHRLLGLIEKDFEKYPAAINNYQEALRRGTPDNVRQEIAVELADCQIELKQFKEALESLKTVDESSEVAMLRARCLTNLGQRDEALQNLTRALTLDPGNIAAAIIKARIHLEMGQAANGLKVLEGFAAAGSKDYEFQFMLAQIHERLGNRDEATKVREIAGQLRALREQFSKLHIQANENPYDAELRFRLAKMAIDLGKPDLAVNWLKATLTLDPAHKEAADLYRTLVNPAE